MARQDLSLLNAILYQVNRDGLVGVSVALPLALAIRLSWRGVSAFPIRDSPDRVVRRDIFRDSKRYALKLARKTNGQRLACNFCHQASGDWHLTVY